MRKRIIEFNGKKQLLKDWANELGIKGTTLNNRLDLLKWSLEKALTKSKDISTQFKKNQSPWNKGKTNWMSEKGRKNIGNSAKLQVGEKSHNWKGNKVGYNGIHSWLNKVFGRANKCELHNCLGISKDFDWALIKGKKYERKRENFIRLCVSCHRHYDETGFLKGHTPWNKGKQHSKEHRLALKKA